MSDVAIEMDGLDLLQRAAQKFSNRFNQAALTQKVMVIAAAAGVMLKEEVVAQLIDAIYSQDAPQVLFSGSGLMDHGGFSNIDRNGDLLDAHQLHNLGLLQVVNVDSEYPVTDNAHSNRETVGDYAIHVHEGYVQYIPQRDGGSFNTQTFHPGRPWFERSWIEAQEVIFPFIEQAFVDLCALAFDEAFS